jgi:hypothetical protein
MPLGHRTTGGQGVVGSNRAVPTARGFPQISDLREPSFHCLAWMPWSSTPLLDSLSRVSCHFSIFRSSPSDCPGPGPGSSGTGTGRCGPGTTRRPPATTTSSPAARLGRYLGESSPDPDADDAADDPCAVDPGVGGGVPGLDDRHQVRVDSTRGGSLWGQFKQPHRAQQNRSPVQASVYILDM